MSERVVIALDAMGGDRAPQVVVAGAALARERQPGARFLLFGDAAELEPMLEAYPLLASAAAIRHTTEKILSEDKPSTAMKTGRNSSMGLAIEAVRTGEAECVVSAGNTGALMALGKVVLKTLPGIDRPAIATYFPTQRGESCMLDLGANVQCDANNLLQFAVMGEVFARTVLGVEKPTIGLLNIGVEALKGNEEVRKAADLLRNTALPILFRGFVEGDDIAAGTVDVVVTDGFTGNVALKTFEGTVHLYTHLFKQAFGSSLMARLGYCLARRAIRNLRDTIDPRHYNGAMLLGLEGVVVKSHGGTDEIGFANAIGVAVDMVSNGFLTKIKDDFEGLRKTPEPSRSAAVV